MSSNNNANNNNNNSVNAKTNKKNKNNTNQSITISSNKLTDQSNKYSQILANNSNPSGFDSTIQTRQSLNNNNDDDALNRAYNFNSNMNIHQSSSSGNIISLSSQNKVRRAPLKTKTETRVNKMFTTLSPKSELIGEQQQLNLMNMNVSNPVINDNNINLQRLKLSEKDSLGLGENMSIIHEDGNDEKNENKAAPIEVAQSGKVDNADTYVGMLSELSFSFLNGMQLVKQPYMIRSKDSRDTVITQFFDIDFKEEMEESYPNLSMKALPALLSIPGSQVMKNFLGASKSGPSYKAMPAFLDKLNNDVKVFENKDAQWIKDQWAANSWRAKMALAFSAEYLSDTYSILKYKDISHEFQSKLLPQYEKKFVDLIGLNGFDELTVLMGFFSCAEIGFDDEVAVLGNIFLANTAMPDSDMVFNSLQNFEGINGSVMFKNEYINKTRPLNIAVGAIICSRFDVPVLTYQDAILLHARTNSVNEAFDVFNHFAINNQLPFIWVDSWDTALILADCTFHPVNFLIGSFVTENAFDSWSTVICKLNYIETTYFAGAEWSNRNCVYSSTHTKDRKIPYIYKVYKTSISAQLPCNLKHSEVVSAAIKYKMVPKIFSNCEKRKISLAKLWTRKIDNVKKYFVDDNYVPGVDVLWASIVTAPTLIDSNLTAVDAGIFADYGWNLNAVVTNGPTYIKADNINPLFWQTVDLEKINELIRAVNRNNHHCTACLSAKNGDLCFGSLITIYSCKMANMYLLEFIGSILYALLSISHGSLLTKNDFIGMLSFQISDEEMLEIEGVGTICTRALIPMINDLTTHISNNFGAIETKSKEQGMVQHMLLYRTLPVEEWASRIPGYISSYGITDYFAIKSNIDNQTYATIDFKCRSNLIYHCVIDTEFCSIKANNMTSNMYHEIGYQIFDSQKKLIFEVGTSLDWLSLGWSAQMPPLNSTLGETNITKVMNNYGGTTIFDHLQLLCSFKDLRFYAQASSAEARFLSMKAIYPVTAYKLKNEVPEKHFFTELKESEPKGKGCCSIHNNEPHCSIREVRGFEFDITEGKPFERTYMDSKAFLLNQYIIEKSLYPLQRMKFSETKQSIDTAVKWWLEAVKEQKVVLKNENQTMNEIVAMKPNWDSRIWDKVLPVG